MLSDRLKWAEGNLTPIETKYHILWEDPENFDRPTQVTQADPNWLAAALNGGVLPPVEAYGTELEQSMYPIGPMTEEQAIDYLIKKDIPPRVWRDYRGNRQILRVVNVEAIPTDRTHRNSWSMKQ